ncbi:unnamed protein product [Musa acuminata subsp. malaccensis]|uniref:(wild Malaysian banana) hypothetical protein n=1 Tax=Musa acuminata subsp. malaccensis TaxID=214687 RepID=A0A804HTE6_MUSAM|nr:unnamed protein product [Musa acuminata subsp. malaccensis]
MNNLRIKVLSHCDEETLQMLYIISQPRHKTLLSSITSKECSISRKIEIDTGNGLLETLLLEVQLVLPLLFCLLTGLCPNSFGK